MNPDLATTADHIGLLVTGGYLICATVPTLVSGWRIEPRWGRVLVVAVMFGIRAVLR